MRPEDEATLKYLEEQIQKLKSGQRSVGPAQPKAPSVGVKDLAVPVGAGLAAYGLTNGFSAAPSLSNLAGAIEGLGTTTFATGTSASTVPAAFQGVTGSAAGGTSGVVGGAGQALQGNLIGPAIGAYTGYKLLKGFGDQSRHGSPMSAIGQGAASGAAIGSYFGPAGAGIGAGIGAITGAVGKFTASGKSKDQMKRDQVRKYLQSIGALNEDFTLDLPTGKFDFGKDGGAKLVNTDGGERSYNQIDWANPLVNQAVGGANPLGYLIGGGKKDSKLSLDMVSYLTNAATTGATTQEELDNNLRSLYTKFGVGDRDTALAGIEQLKADQKLGEEEYNAFSAEINRLFPGAPAPAASGGGIRAPQFPEEQQLSRKKLRRPIDSGFSKYPDPTETFGKYYGMLNNMAKGGYGQNAA